MRFTQSSIGIGLVALGCATSVMGTERIGKRPIALTVVDDHAIAFATFQSHNQKVGSDAKAIYITYLHKSNPDYTAQQWRLAKSSDGGRTFATIHEATHATSAPAVEIDTAGTLYLGHPHFTNGNAYLTRFVREDPRQHLTTELTGGSAGKYCLLLDEPRQQLYWFAHNNTFFTVGTDGALRSKVTLIQAGQHAYLQYPHLTLDGTGTLVAAWTTSKEVKPGLSIYHDIHAMKSTDAGQTWQSLDGRQLALPVVADDTGPATLISQGDEFDVHSWLSALLAKEGKLHLAYWAKTQPERQWYVRYDIASGRRDKELQPLFSERPSQRPNDSGAFAADRAAPGSRLVFVSTVDDGSRLACLASDDNGASWFEYALSDQQFAGRIYSIGAARSLTPDGAVIGTFTLVRGKPNTYYEDDSGSVYFFRIDTRALKPDAGQAKDNQ